MRGGIVKYLTMCLDVAGVLALSLFAFLIWPPLALLVLGGFALLASWRLSQ